VSDCSIAGASIVRAVFSISFVYEIDASFLLMRYSGQVRELTTLV
jgi:hypothetical protein